MKKLTKLASVVLAAAMVMSSLTACGGSNAGSANADATTFKIGGIGPITGGAAVYGQAVMNGAQIAIDEINAAGGINGYQVEFNPQDDEHDAEKSVNAYNTLKDWGMQHLLGTVTSAPCIAVEAEAVNDNMFLLTPSGTAVECISGDNACRVCFADPTQGTESAKYIAANELATKVAVIYDSSDPYSAGIYNAFQIEAANQDVFEIVAAEAFTSDNKTDFSVQIQKAKDAGADMVYMPFYYNEAALVLKQAKDMGYEPKWFGGDGMDGILDLEGFDTTLAEGLMYFTPFSAAAEDEKTQNFVAAFKEMTGGIPNQFGADAYDGIYIMKMAMEKAGVTPDMDASEICDLMKVAMQEITFDGITGSQITWDAAGEPVKAPLAVVINNGVAEFM